MADQYCELKDWAKGVILANEGDVIPFNSSSKAWNTALRSVGSGQTVMGMRPGLVTVNTTAFSGTPKLHRMAQYNYNNSGTAVRYLAVWGNDGSLRFKQDDDTFTSELTPPANFPFTSGHCFASGEFPVDAVVMANRLLCVNTNGERRSLLNQTFKAFGLLPIATVAVSAQAGGSSSMPLETYDVAVSSYDSATGAESSRSAEVSVTLAGANNRIRIIITPSASESALYTHWRVHLRRQTTQPIMYQVQKAEDNGGATIMTNANVPIGTTTVYLDLSSAEIADHIIASPSTTENDPPEDTVKYMIVYGGRLLVADTRFIYWSKLDAPDNFPPENAYEVAAGTGEQITALELISADKAAIFTANGIFIIDGNDPLTWIINPINRTSGAVARTGIATLDEGVAFWDSKHGPALLMGGTVNHIGWDKLGPALLIDEVEVAQLTGVACAVDPQDQRIVWSVPSLNSSRNDFMLPFNYQIGEWESSKWDPIDAASLCSGYDGNGNQRLFVGGYAGQVFKFDSDTHNDAAPSGTVSGTFVATGMTQGTITDTGFYTTGSGLKERRVTIVDANNRPLGRYRISSNTATVLTLATNMTNLTTGSTYSYYIGGADFRLYTKWVDMDQPFLDKRFDRLFVHVRSPDESTGLLVATQMEFVDSEDVNESTVELLGDTWDTGVWDSAYWAGQGTFKRRQAIFKTASAMRFGLLHFQPNKDLMVLKIGILARMLSDRNLGT